MVNIRGAITVIGICKIDISGHFTKDMICYLIIISTKYSDYMSLWFNNVSCFTR